MKTSDLYKGQDPRDFPTYNVREAAHHLRLSQSTLRLWVSGCVREDGRQSLPVFQPARPERPVLLSFWNLVEAQVLATIRRRHSVSMQKVRRAIGFLSKHFSLKRPLIHADFATDGVHLFLQEILKDVGDRPVVVNASAGGLQEMTDELNASLQRVERDEKGLAAKWYPWTNTPTEESRSILVDPWVSFGRPVLSGTGIPSKNVADRFSGGESFKEIAKDFEVEAALVEDAVRWELASTIVA